MMSAFTTAIQQLVVAAIAIKQGKEIKGIKITKKE